MAKGIKARYQKHIFLTSALLTLVVFSAGITVGWWLDSFRVDDTLAALRGSELDLQGFIVEEQFLNTFTVNESCSILIPRFERLSSDSAKIGKTLTEYESKKIFRDADYNYLKRQYFISEARNYMALLDLKNKCDLKTIAVLYFYKKDESSSIMQGYILDALVKKYSEKNISIYSFDFDFEEPLINLIKNYYNVTGTPTLVINNNIIKSGFASREELEPLIEIELE